MDDYDMDAMLEEAQEWNGADEDAARYEEEIEAMLAPVPKRVFAVQPVVMASGAGAAAQPALRVGAIASAACVRVREGGARAREQGREARATEQNVYKQTSKTSKPA